MAPNHGGRRVGRRVNALVACAVVVMTGSVTGAAASGALGGTPAPLQAKIMLTSIGTDNVPAAAPNAHPAISANGRYVAFQSQATLNTSASVIPPPPTPTQPTTPPPASSPITLPTTPPPSTPPPPPPSTPPPPPPTTQSPTIQPPGVVPGAAPRAAAQSSANWRVYVRDQTGNVTSLLSNPQLGNATAPTISGDGKLVSYLLSSGTENNVFAVNRQATGKGPFDTAANLVVKQVTGTPNDLPFERIPDCPDGISAPKPATRTTPCGPQLSADGSTLAYPAQLSPVSPDLSVTINAFDAATTGNLIDFGGAASGAFDSRDLNYTDTGSQPVTITGISATAPFSVTTDPDLNDCIGTTLQPVNPADPTNPASTCSAQFVFNTDVCPQSGTAEFTGTVQTQSPVPDGQSSVAVAVFCNPVFGETAARSGPPRVNLLAAAGCGPLPQGLPIEQASATEQTNAGDSLLDFGSAVVGQPFAAIVSFTAPNGSSPQFSSTNCGLQLVTPEDIGLPTGPSETCTSPDEGPESCTAYVLVNPGTAGTDVASFIGEEDDPAFTQISTYVTVTGVSDVVIARHDKTGDGNFAASPSTEVSVTSKGVLIPDASEPSVSATGRYIAFTASAPTASAADLIGVYRHDTDSAGNGTGQPGGTSLVSCVGGASGGVCESAPDADSPSISGDGSQVAFATIADVGQVYVWDVTTRTSTLVSAPASGPIGAQGNGPSYAPAISQDGSTIAYISMATDLAATPTAVGSTNLFVRNLSPGAPAVNELVSSTGASLPANDDIALPDVDASGGLITFQTSQQLLPQAPAAVTSVYTFEREPVLSFSPSPVSFGTMKVGTAPATVTVTVTNIGPGPGTVTSAGTTGPFGITVGACGGAVLHDGGSCVLTVSFVPLHAGTDTGSLTSTVTDELGSPIIFSAPVTATVLAVTERARIGVNPGVAPAGQVTFVTGSGFLPDQQVTLSWDPGLGQKQVKASSSGGITAVMVIFPDDFTGLRVLEARSNSGQVLATVNFLVQQPTPEPPSAPFGSGSGPGLVIAPG